LIVCEALAGDSEPEKLLPAAAHVVENLIDFEIVDRAVIRVESVLLRLVLLVVLLLN
jgi:hypothetical protein